MSAHDAARLLNAAGVPAAVVAGAHDLHTDAQLIHRGHFLHLNHPVPGDFRYGALSYRLDGALPLPQRAAPLLGQHNVSVYQELLGLSEEEYAALEAGGVLSQAPTPSPRPLRVSANPGGGEPIVHCDSPSPSPPQAEERGPGGEGLRHACSFLSPPLPCPHPYRRAEARRCCRSTTSACSTSRARSPPRRSGRRKGGPPITRSIATSAASCST